MDGSQATMLLCKRGELLTAEGDSLKMLHKPQVGGVIYGTLDGNLSLGTISLVSTAI